MFNPFDTLGPKYDLACMEAENGNWTLAEEILLSLLAAHDSPSARVQIENDLNELRSILAEVSMNTGFASSLGLTTADPLYQHQDLRDRQSHSPAAGGLKRTRVAILSLLFNWPSTGGGTIHTAEAGYFLSEAGYEVHHWFARFPEWGIGEVGATPPLANTTAIEFNEASWSRGEIVSRFKAALDEFKPDFVIITDSWNFKPLLAEAARDYKYFLRLAAQECLCPLNNVRLLVDADGTASVCPRHQLATPATCIRCVGANQRHSGQLHQQERQLSGFGEESYDRKLRDAFAQAEGILVVNPLIASHVSPYSRRVHVVPSGFDPSRFTGCANAPTDPAGPVQLLFAGLASEYMKGFHILVEACRLLWIRRQDFSIVVTSDPVGDEIEPFLNYIGWQSQASLPQRMGEAGIIVVPTVAEEALGRTAVEAMAASRPVIASRIGGLQFVVNDGSTGLLFTPGDHDELASAIEHLLDSPRLRQQLGVAGRRKFDKEYTWEAVIRKYYRALLGPPLVANTLSVEARRAQPPV